MVILMNCILSIEDNRKNRILIVEGVLVTYNVGIIKVKFNHNKYKIYN